MKDRYKELLIFLLFVFLTILLFRNYVFKKEVPFPANLLISFYQPWAQYEWEGVPKNLGVPHKPIGFDNLRIFFPLRKVTTDAIKNNSWPLWNPYSFAGNTQLATYQSAVFHPLSFLFLILPQIDAWSIIVVLEPLFASIFMYLFLKELSLGRKASIFGAIVFGFSPFLLVWMEESFMAGYSALFLPLILYGSEKMRKKIAVLPFALFVFGLTFSLLSGWFQMTLYVWTLVFCWILYRYFAKKEQKSKSYLFYSIAGFILALLLSAIHLIPNFEAYLNSARGTTDAKFIFDLYLLPLSHLLTFFAPDFFGNPGTYNYFGSGFYYERIIYIGIVPLFFVLYELITSKRNSHGTFFLVAWVVTLSLGFSLPTSWFLLYQIKFPFLSTVLPSRIFFLSTFCASILSAYGMEKYFKKPDKKRIMALLFLVSIIFTALWVFVLYHKFFIHNELNLSNIITVSLRNLILPTGLFILMSLLLLAGIVKNELRKYVYVGCIIITFASSIYFANKYFYFSERRFVFPQTPVLTELQKISGINRVWSFGKGYIERNFLTYYKLFSPEGYDSIFNRRYGELLFAAENNGIVSEQIPRADAVLRSAEKEEQILTDPYRKTLLSLLGVRYVAASATDSAQKKSISDLEQVWNDGTYAIYEYKKSYPRFFLSSDYQVVKGKQDILNTIFNQQTDLAKTIILEEEPKDITKKEKLQGEVDLISYKPEEILFNVRISDPSILFLSDNYYPGWKASIDGKETKIYRADYTFRAAVIPKGNHVVSFQYKPQSFLLGFWTSFLGLLLFVLLAGKIRYKL